MKTQNYIEDIHFRVLSSEKAEIAGIAKTCGLPGSEYARQRCLGYAPRAVPPDACYVLLAKLDQLPENASREEVHAVLDDIRHTLIEPGRDV